MSTLIDLSGPLSRVVRHQMDSLVVVLFVLAAAAIILWIIKPR